MRRMLFTTFALLAWGVTWGVTWGATGAFAADLPRGLPPVRSPSYMPAGYTWTGFYAGINGGYGWGTSDWAGFATNTDVDGGLVGLTAGYNVQVNALVFGLEGDIDWSNIRGSFANAACPLGCETRNNWLGTVRGRIGYAFARVMPYVTGGLAVGDIQARPTGFAGVSDTNAGWTVGGGVEAAFAGNWTAKLEYLYVDLGDIGCSTVACGVASNVDLRASIVRGGINYRF